MESSITHTESDICLRLVEVWFDATWAYYMSPSVEQFCKRMEKQRRSHSSTASVTSGSVADGSIVGKSVQEKLYHIQKGLKAIKKHMGIKEFAELCTVCLKSSDQLYPGFRDILLIVKYLLRESDTYRGSLTSTEIDGVTLPQAYQYIYYQLADFLLRTSKGSEALKLLTHPVKITHATYDICRQKFCRLLCDETEIVEYGLLRLVKSLVKQRPPIDEPEPEPEPEPDAEVVDPDPEPAPAPVNHEDPEPEPAPVDPVPVEEVVVEEHEPADDVSAITGPDPDEDEDNISLAVSTARGERQPRSSYSSVPFYKAYGTGKMKDATTKHIPFPLRKFSKDSDSSNESSEDEV